MFKYGWKAFARYEPSMAAHSFFIERSDENGRSFVKSIELEKVGRHGVVSMPHEQAIPPDEVEDFLRAMMNAAWEIGLRPNGFDDHTNELTAVRYHLEDMRTLAKVKT